MSTALVSADQVAAALGDLPTLPAIHTQIVELSSSDTTSASDLQKVIEVDPVLATKLLKLVNSAFYGFPVEIATIERAVMIIGFKGVVQLALSTAFVDLFADEDESGFDYEDFWKHSIATAVAARRISKAVDAASPEEMLLAGLIHDLGALVLAQKIPTEFGRALSLAKDSGRHLFDAERETLGFDHADTGRALVTLWRLPEQLARAVGDHHNPGRRGQPTLESSIVHVAEIVAAGTGIGCEGDGFVPPLQEAAWDAVGLTLRDLTGIVDGLEDESAMLLEMIRG